MLRTSLRSLWSHKRRLISTCIAVVLGVAFMSGTLVLTGTINRAFDALFDTGFAGVDAVVRGPVLFDDQQSGINHIGFTVDDCAAALASLAARGYELVDEEPTPGPSGSLTAYVHPPDQPGTLIQLVQP